MQGGHPDGLRFRFGSIKPEESSGNESEISIDDQISLGSRLDRIVYIARELFGTCLALPVAWIQLQPSIQALRNHKRRRIETGAEWILWIQSFRTKVLDLIMQIISFCAEEEFYLLILPLLFWNGFYDLATRFTFVVVTGLFVGNIIKDVFELPRPSSPPVWRPINQEHLDSTALQDFGYPSTHAMNSVSNSILIVWYYVDRNDIWSSYNILLYFGAFCWIFFLSLSRMYLGAHTATDVRGGLGLGLLVIGTYIKVFEPFPDWLSNIPVMNLFTSLFLFSCVALLLCPQPRPPTPTFHQNAFLVGLLWGLFVGYSMAYHEHLTSLSLDFKNLNDFPILATYLLPILKNICGFAMVIVIRQIVKSSISILFEKVFNINLKPRSEVVKIRSAATRGRKRVIRLFTRDIDIIAMACVKTLTYFMTALCITFLFPYSWRYVMQQLL